MISNTNVFSDMGLAMHSSFVLVLNFAKLLIQLILLTRENKSIIIQWCQCHQSSSFFTSLLC